MKYDVLIPVPVVSLLALDDEAARLEGVSELRFGLVHQHLIEVDLETLFLGGGFCSSASSFRLILRFVVMADTLLGRGSCRPLSPSPGTTGVDTHLSTSLHQDRLRATPIAGPSYRDRCRAVASGTGWRGSRVRDSGAAATAVPRSPPG